MLEKLAEKFELGLDPRAFEENAPLINLQSSEQ